MKETIEIRKENEIHSPIDWEQRRYEIAKAAMQAQLSNQYGDVMVSGCEYKKTAETAIMFADALIAELKKGSGR